MPEMGIVFHQVPQEWAVTNHRHWFWNRLRHLPQPHALTATEKNNLHPRIVKRPPRAPAPILNLFISVFFRSGWAFVKQANLAEFTSANGPGRACHHHTLTSGIGTANWPPHSRI